MSNFVDLLDAVIRVRQGENRAAALELINRVNGRVVKQAEIASISYTIFRRAFQHTIQNMMTPPVDTPVEGHIDREIPVESIIDDPQPDPLDNVPYNFIYVIPCLDEMENDITPFTVAGATYDMVIRFIPVAGIPYAMQRTIRIECV